MIERLKQYKKFIAYAVGAGAITGNEALDDAIGSALGLADGLVTKALLVVTGAAVVGLRNAQPVPDIEYDEIDGLPQDDEYVATGE